MSSALLPSLLSSSTMTTTFSLEPLHFCHYSTTLEIYFSIINLINDTLKSPCFTVSRLLSSCSDQARVSKPLIEMAMATASAVKPMSGSLDLVIELIWQHAMAHLKSTKNEILLPADINTVIGQDNVEKIKDRLRCVDPYFYTISYANITSSALLSTPVVAFKDDVNRVYRIMPTPVLDGIVDAAVVQVMPMIVTSNEQSVSSSPKVNKVTLEKPEKIPRPPNAFILYRRHHHPLVKATHPDFHNNEICWFFIPVINDFSNNFL